MKYKHSRDYSLRGFTLIELMVSMAIMMTMTGILFIRYPETIKRLTLANLTYTVALLIREAQVRGSAIDSENSSIGGYGVYFSLANPNKAILFGDSVDGTVSPYEIVIGNGLYDTLPVNEAKTITTLPAGFSVSRLCVGTGFPFSCNSNNIPPITTLTISLTRPDPKFNLYINDSKSILFSAGCVELQSPLGASLGHIRSVQIFNSGIIRTTNTKCD
jgi:hypothetical protein